MGLYNAFSPRYKLPVHIVQIILVSAAIGLSAPRLFMKPRPKTRANTIALGMGAKSLIIIGYQLITEYVPRFHRWASLKANFILNSLENLFWGAVAFLVMQAALKSCTGVGCGLSWAVFGIAAVLTMLAAWTAFSSYLEWRQARRIEKVSSSSSNSPMRGSGYPSDRYEMQTGSKV